MLSSRLDSSRENQSRTWRKIWRTLIEACRWISPPLRSTHTSPLAKVMEQKHHQEHSEIWRSESCRTSGFTTSVCSAYQREPSALLDTLIYLHVAHCKIWMWTKVNLWDATRLVDIFPNHESQAWTAKHQRFILSELDISPANLRPSSVTRLRHSSSA